MTERLDNLLNLGPATARWLEEAGIETAAELRRIGAIEAWARLFRQGRRGLSRNALYALDGAVHGLRWNQLPPARRRELDAAWRRIREEKS